MTKKVSVKSFGEKMKKFKIYNGIDIIRASKEIIIGMVVLSASIGCTVVYYIYDKTEQVKEKDIDTDELIKKAYKIIYFNQGAHYKYF